ncbi:MAG: KTSC domain-containing protein, partial [Salinarchaeum sp.]
TDWTIEYELRGADQPRQDAETARRKINAVNGAIPVNRALEMIGEDPLPDDVDIDGDSTLIADIGGGGGQPGGEPGGEPSVEEQLPPEDNKIGERDWDDVKADLATKEIETQQFSSSNLDEGLYDYDEQELYLSFKREGQSSLYAYVDVPPAEWSGLTNASSHGSYHYDNIRLAYGYVEITNFHDRLPEGPIPDDPPDDVPTQLSASCGGRDFSERRKTPEGVPNDAFHIDDESECDGTVHEGPRGGLYCSPDGGDNTPGPDTIQEEAPEQWDGSDESREQVQDAVESAVAEGAGVSEALEAAREHIDNLDASGERVVAETAYIHQTESVEVGGQTVESGPVVSDAYSTNISEIREAAESELDTESYEHPRLDDTHASQQDFNGWREERDGSLLNSDTAELWGAAIDTTGNDNVPDDAAADPDTVGDPLPAAEGDEPVTAIGDSISVTRETLRETFGDTVPVARGVSGEFAEEIREAAENGEDIDIEHRALESWSTFPAHAERFAQEGDDGGIIIRTEIPVDEVWGSSHTTPGLAEEENELIVGKDGPESYSPENIYTPDDGDLTDLYVDAAEA